MVQDFVIIEWPGIIFLRALSYQHAFSIGVNTKHLISWGIPTVWLVPLSLMKCHVFIFKISRLAEQSVHYENTPMQYTAIFHRCKNDNFHMKKVDNFLIFAQNIDCGYTLEPPQWGGSNEYPQSMFKSKNKKIVYTPVNPNITIWKWGVRGSSLHGHVSMMFCLIWLDALSQIFLGRAFLSQPRLLSLKPFKCLLYPPPPLPPHNRPNQFHSYPVWVNVTFVTKS